MAIDTSIARSRRALLAGAIGGAAALTASALGRPLPARAGTDGDVVLGAENTATTLTSIVNYTNAEGVFRAESGGGTAISGASSSYGVYGSSWTRAGVYGVSQASDWPGTVGRSTGDSTGVLGFSSSDPLPSIPAETGVYGYADQSTDACGVHGYSSAGRGVYGQATSGTGVHGHATSGTGVSGETGTGVGVAGASTESSGVEGSSSTGSGVVGSSEQAVGVLGSGPLGVAGWSEATTGVTGWVAIEELTDAPPSPKTGVFGYAVADSSCRGVHGQAAAGRGVYGQATSGYGVRGYVTTGTAGYFATQAASAGYALRAVGRVKLDNCAGVATVAAGTKSIPVTPGIELVPTSAVVATLQGNPGGTTTVQRVSVNSTANTFTIYLTANATAAVKVAWIVIG